MPAEEDRSLRPARYPAMLSSRMWIGIGSVVFGGAALAWVLPPTTPIGGPTVAQLSVARSAHAESSPADATLPQLPPVSAPVPPPDIAPPTPDRAVPLLEADDDVARDAGPQAPREDPERAFRLGYRLAERSDMTDPGECDRFANPDRVDGCLAYLNDADRSADDGAMQDPPDGY